MTLGCAKPFTLIIPFRAKVKFFIITRCNLARHHTNLISYFSLPHPSLTTPGSLLPFEPSRHSHVRTFTPAGPQISTWGISGGSPDIRFLQVFAQHDLLGGALTILPQCPTFLTLTYLFLFIAFLTFKCTV